MFVLNMFKINLGVKKSGQKQELEEKNLRRRLLMELNLKAFEFNQILKQILSRSSLS